MDPHDRENLKRQADNEQSDDIVSKKFCQGCSKLVQDITHTSEEGAGPSGSGLMNEGAAVKVIKNGDPLEVRKCLPAVSDKFTVTLPTPLVKLITQKRPISEEKQFAGFNWQFFVSIQDMNLFVKVYCEMNSRNTIWVCQAKCEVKMVDKNNTVISSKNAIHNFGHGSNNVNIQMNEGWAVMINDVTSSKDEETNIYCTVQICTDAGLRNFSLINFSQPSVTSDVILLAGNRRFHVNKATLALQSPFFESLFYSDFREKSQSEVVLEDLDSLEFEEFLYALYPSGFPICFRHLRSFLKLADRFQVNGLLARCERIMCECITSGRETHTMIILADQYKLPLAVTAFAHSLRDCASVKAFARETVFQSLSTANRLQILQRMVYLD